MEITKQGCELERSFCSLSAESYFSTMLKEPNWETWLQVEGAIYWLNEKLKKIVGFIEGDVVTYHAATLDQFASQQIQIQTFYQNYLRGAL